MTCALQTPSFAKPQNYGFSCHFEKHIGNPSKLLGLAYKGGAN
uniref:Uncharacterized protein n=1 Tax=Lotus japonicus TaxID=34305 RepID=I3STG9_LOTJA|nr:unknown [Lotus japonicus]